MIDVLVVDDSAFMRKALSMMLERDDEVQVVGAARNGAEGVRKVKTLHPDIVTMDVEMPEMDGLTALRRIMKEAPLPVLMISSLTRKGAQTTLDALDAGAVDFLPKQTSDGTARIMGVQETLIAKVKAIADAKPTTSSASPDATAGRSSLQPLRSPIDLIAIGVSTGGPKALQKVIPALPAHLSVPVIVVQHMPPHFTTSLAARLDQISPLRVAEAEDGMTLAAGRVLVAHGGRHLLLQRRSRKVLVTTPQAPADTLYQPSINLTFRSAAEAYNGRVLGLVMTGMGKDGLEGARSIKEHGGAVIAQDEATSIIYGMPRAVVEAGLADSVLPLRRLGTTLAEAVSETESRAGRVAQGL